MAACSGVFQAVDPCGVSFGGGLVRGGAPGLALVGRPFVVSLRHESDLKVRHAVLSHLSDGLVLKKRRWFGFN